MVVRLLRVWVMLAARSGAPPAPSMHREASPRGPHPPPRLQLWREGLAADENWSYPVDYL
jgi:hypothetical protein